MPDVKEMVAEPSAATAVPASPEHIDLATLTPEDRQTWRETGEIPAKPKVAEPAPPDPSKARQPEPKGKSAAEPGAAEPQKDHKAGKLTAEQRIAQLTREKKELEERLRTRESVAQPTPKTEPAKEPVKAEAPKRPNPFTWKGTPEEYEAAQEKWENHQKAQAVYEFQARQAQDAASKEMQSKLADARQRYQDADTKIMPALDKILNSQIPNAIKAMFDDSPVLPDLLYTLGDEAKLTEFLEKARTNPGQALREIVVLEGLIQEELKTGSKKPAAKESSEDEKPAKEAKTEEKPSAAPQTRAPKPVSEVGGRGTAPDDPAIAAVKGNNFAAAKNEWNRRAQEGRIR